MLAQTFGLLQYRDIEIWSGVTSVEVSVGQPGKLDGARQAGRAGADDENIHFDRFGVRVLLEDQPVERERCLMATGNWPAQARS